LKSLTRLNLDVVCSYEKAERSNVSQTEDSANKKIDYTWIRCCGC